MNVYYSPENWTSPMITPIISYALRRQSVHLLDLVWHQAPS